jgi:hypothetical protein
MLPLRFTKSHYSGFFSVVMLCNFAVKHCNQGLTFRRWLDIRSAHKAGAYPSSAVSAESVFDLTRRPSPADIRGAVRRAPP